MGMGACASSLPEGAEYRRSTVSINTEAPAAWAAALSTEDVRRDMARVPRRLHPLHLDNASLTSSSGGGLTWLTTFDRGGSCGLGRTWLGLPRSRSLMLLTAASAPTG
jgi:hypothetical protein